MAHRRQACSGLARDAQNRGTLLPDVAGLLLRFCQDLVVIVAVSRAGVSNGWRRGGSRRRRLAPFVLTEYRGKMFLPS